VRSVIKAGSSDLGSVESATTSWPPRLPAAGAAFAGVAAGVVAGTGVSAGAGVSAAAGVVAGAGAVAAAALTAGAVAAGFGALAPGVGGAPLVGAPAHAASVSPPTI
jgi:hypothetical protein